jgi:hypothetical protein
LQPVKEIAQKESAGRTDMLPELNTYEKPAVSDVRFRFCGLRASKFFYNS